MNTTFVLLHVPNPRMNKRIAFLKTLGKCDVLSFRRKVYDLWEPEHHDVSHDIVDFDLPPSSQPIKRAMKTPQLQSIIQAKLDAQMPDCVYTAGLDALMAVVKCKKRSRKPFKIVYEVADLRSTHLEQGRGIVKRLMSGYVETVEKKLLREVDLLVLTSEAYYDCHFNSVIPREKAIVVPNVPDPVFFAGYSKKTSGPFTVGYIGGIRYLEQMKMLVDASRELGVRVLFAGGGETDSELLELREYCSGMDFVTFTGKYRYEEEIAELYGRIDCVYSVYDASIPNVRIALPNKLYEAILCELPIVVAKETLLSRVVESWGVGVSVDCKSKEELIGALRDLRDDAALRGRLDSAIQDAREHADYTLLSREFESRIMELGSE